MQRKRPDACQRAISWDKRCPLILEFTPHHEAERQVCAVGADLNLSRFGLTPARTERLMRDLVSQTLTELSDLYSVRYAALRHDQNA